jgi:ABC-type transport system involved in multi-copper enzyme maturation permease subunit
MIWLTWRQFRTQAGVVFAALAALAVILAITGPQLAHLYDTGIAACGTENACRTFNTTFFEDHQFTYFGLIAVVMVVPGIIGLFWGAPLVTREIEAGTHRLVWNQSVTRTRWLAVKLGLTGLAAIAAAGLASLMVTWWSSPIDQAIASEDPRLSPLIFAARGIVPIGYAAFAFALGVTVGTLLRRSLPAMAITLAAFIAIQLAMPLGIRPYIITPVRLTTEITATNLRGLQMAGPDGPVQNLSVNFDAPGAWILSNQTIDATGQVADPLPSWLISCMPAPPGRPGQAASQPSQPDLQACFTRLANDGYRQLIVYQPGSRYWAFQWTETAIFLAFAGILAGFCSWWMRRRLA